MKRIKVCMVLLLGVLFFLGALGVVNSYAQEKQKVEALELDGTEWGITLSYVDKKGEQQAIIDKLIFKDKVFSSEFQEKNKYDPSNYTLSIKDDDATVFETMQTKGEDKSFWRGEIRGNGIRGILSIHLSGGLVQDYAFAGGLSSGQLGETRKSRLEKEAAEQAVKEEAARKAEEAKQAAARAAEIAAAKAAGNYTEEESGATEQSFGEKLKGMLNKITGSTEEGQPVSQ